MQKLSLIFVIVGLFFFLVYFFLLFLLDSKKKKEERCSILNSFGYQFYASLPVVFRMSLYAVLILAALFVAVGEALYFSSLHSFFFLVLSFALPLSLLFLVASNLVPLSKYRPHIFLAALGFVFFSLSSLAYSFSTVIPGAVLYRDSVLLFSQVILGVIGAISFLSIFNPKLLDWPKMEKSEVNGTTYYLKPKVNHLALYEWGFLFLEILVALVLVINGMMYEMIWM